MIRHAWSVLCDKHLIDMETNNISLDVVEQITGLVRAPRLARDQRILLPVPLRLVSLWYRLEAEPEQGRARLAVEGPDGAELGHVDLQLNLEQQRQRTIVMLGGVPFDRPGWYHYVLTLQDAAGAHEVARVPLLVTPTLQMTDAAPDAPPAVGVPGSG